MLNARGTLWSIFGILFILSMVSTAFAQQSDSALPQSQFEKILEKIDESEKETRAYIDQKFDKLDTKIDEKFDKLDKRIDDLETKFHELDKKVALVDLKANILIGVFGVIITLVVIPILVPVLKQVVINRLTPQNNSEGSQKPQVGVKEHLEHGNFGDKA